MHAINIELCGGIIDQLVLRGVRGGAIIEGVVGGRIYDFASLSYVIGLLFIIVHEEKV